LNISLRVRKGIPFLTGGKRGGWALRYRGEKPLFLEEPDTRTTGKESCSVPWTEKRRGKYWKKREFKAKRVLPSCS